MANFVFGFSNWKKSWFKDYIESPIYIDRLYFCFLFFIDAVNPFSNTILYIWAYKDGRFFRSNLLFKVVRVEDGFIRSKGLGSNKTKPLSLVFEESNHLYFDASRKSDIDNLILNTKLTEAEELKSKVFLKNIRALKITKYGLDTTSFNVDNASVLVVGQVEDDQSVVLGGGVKTNLELVELACRENPEKKIYYKRHPDILSGNRVAESNIEDILMLATVIDHALEVEEIVKSFDITYVNTSLMGFEILISGGKVRVVGKPFYWGLGLTNDYISTNRAQCSIEELAYKVYVMFPEYHPENIIYKIGGAEWA